MATAPKQNPHESDSDTGRNRIETTWRWEWIVGGLITLAAVHLHGVFLTHAGGLWRDEASTVWLATLPTFREVWKWLPYDHCPVMPHVIIRAWSALGWGKTDSELRVLGLLIGLLLPAAFWIASRMMRRGVPLLPLVMVVLNVTVIRVGDSFRGYGLGCALNVLALALTWRMAQKPTFVNALLATLAAVFSVQCLYQNAFFVLAGCCGGIAICAKGRRWRDMVWILGIGLAAAASLVPYIHFIIRSREWYVLQKTGFSFAGGWEAVSNATGLPFAQFSWLWAALCGSAILIALWAALRGARAVSNDPLRNLILFGGVALVVGVAGFAVFLKTAGLPTQSWYYLPLMAFVAACLDAILPACHRWARPALTVFAAFVAIAAYPIGLPPMKCRQTDVDVLAARLTQEATPDDYIIVQPWYCGASFARYYKGAAPWNTLPPLEDHFLHRYDLLKIKMQMENPIQPVLDKAAATLQSGHRIWVVGGIPLDGKPPPDLRPAPNGPWGWYDAPYLLMWGAKAGFFIATHAGQGTVVMDRSTNCVNPYENLPVVLITGWQSPAPQ